MLTEIKIPLFVFSQAGNPKLTHDPFALIHPSKFGTESVQLHHLLKSFTSLRSPLLLAALAQAAALA